MISEKQGKYAILNSFPDIETLWNIPAVRVIVFVGGALVLLVVARVFMNTTASSITAYKKLQEAIKK